MLNSISMFAYDGTKCVGSSIEEVQQVCANYEAVQRRKDTAKSLHHRRISQAFIRDFYTLWGAWSGYKNPDGLLRFQYDMHHIKLRIIRLVVRRARANGWYMWRKNGVFYCETAFGQCSWHIYCHTKAELRWFNSFPERDDLAWSEVRNSDEVICRVLSRRMRY